MTDEALKGLAFQAANMAKTELRYRHELNGLLAIYYEGSGLRRMRKMEKLAIEKGGKGWLDSGVAKDIVFGVMATVAKAMGRCAPDAVVVATAIKDYVATPAFWALPDPEKERIFEVRYPRNYPQYFQAHDALMALAQTSERVCVYRQRLNGSLLTGEPKIDFHPQEGFGGRLKFYGGETSPEMEDALNELLRERTQ